MRKLSTKWVPKCLKADQTRQRCQSSEQLLEFFRRDPNYFLSRLVTMDKTWLYHYDPETKQQSMEWRHSGSTRPKKFRVQKSAGKVLVSIFFGIKTASSSFLIFQRAKLSTRSITHLCWCNWRAFWRKNAAGRSLRGFCSCTTIPRLARHLQPRKKMAHRGFQCLDHPPYFPDLAPSDYDLFPGLKKQLKGRHFSSDTEVIVAAETWLDRQPSEFFLSVLQKLEQLAKQCIGLRGEYVE